MIYDKYTYQALSRQRKYQLRKRDAIKCIICGKPSETAHHCREHAETANEGVKRTRKRKSLIPNGLSGQPV